MSKTRVHPMPLMEKVLDFIKGRRDVAHHELCGNPVPSTDEPGLHFGISKDSCSKVTVCDGSQSQTLKFVPRGNATIARDLLEAWPALVA